MDLEDRDVRPLDQRLVRIIEHEFCQHVPRPGMIEKIVPTGVLHYAHSPQFPKATPCSKVLPAMKEVALSQGIPVDLVIGISCTARDRKAVVI